ncbi:MAG TPA: glycosyltransferase [Tepidiformaceae bacterium]|nr:glycosyltransferase [Tepidiformaceae bacterium]
MTRPTVDVVIATYNRQARLTRTLDSLQRQSMGGFGVIVVDDGSDPPVKETTSAGLARSLGVRFLATDGNRGPAAARNAGVAASEASLIAFIDDDVDADPSWLEAHLARRVAAGPAAVTIGPMLAPRDWRPTPWNRWEAARLEVEYARMERGEYPPTWRQFFTGNAIVPRSLLLAAGGFNESLRRAEDIELGMRLARLGAQFIFEPKGKGWHYAYRTRAAWLRNAEQYAAVDVTIDHLYPELFWLDLINDELRRRPPASRATRSVATRLLGAGRAVSASALAATVLNRGPFTTLAVRAASLAYDIKYREALAHALATGTGFRAGESNPAVAGGATVTRDQQPNDQESIGSRAV